MVEINTPQVVPEVIPKPDMLNGGNAVEQAKSTEVDTKALPKYGSKTIMLVEDDAFLSNLLVTRLRGVGFNVIRASTGEEALNVLRTQTPPDLILLDIILPEKSGFEVLEEIQSDPTLQKAFIIITSNLGQESDIERGKQLGVTEYFVKARITIDDLVEKIKEITNRPSGVK